jgi:hypothetical protein
MYECILVSAIKVNLFVLNLDATKEINSRQKTVADLSPGHSRAIYVAKNAFLIRMA